MPRNYKPSNTKCYKKYDVLAIEAALSDYRNSQHSLADIALKHGITKSVLHRHNTRIMKNHGGQTALSSEEENYIVENLNYCSEWGYPLDTYDLRLLVKGYLDRVGVVVRRFRDNLPGQDFVNGFLNRHKSKISTRICQNIKKCRAAVSPEIISEYFDELQVSLADVPLQNIINYDETNLSDYPGRRKVITRRGAKYPERIMNYSKAANSIMMAASADGTLLPCYVVYKSLNLYKSWMEEGPRDCRYNRTTSGWFDSNTFEDWVLTIAMPYFDKLDGKKILIGDNLSSHLSINLIKQCKEKNIHFVFLPANSTHLTQPLDVAFFRPVKMAWRNILFNWKKTEGRNLPTIPKHVFPRLLKKMLVQLENKVESNIRAGFYKTGIVPLDKEKVLERLPGYNAERSDNSKQAIDETVLAFLKDMRYDTGTKTTTYKRKKIDLKPGQSVCLADEHDESHTTTETEINDRNLDKKTQDTDTEGISKCDVKINRKRKIGLKNVEQDDIFKKPAVPIKRICLPKSTTMMKNADKTKAEGKETNEGEAENKKIKIFSYTNELDIPSTSGKYVKGKGIGKKSKKNGPTILPTILKEYTNEEPKEHNYAETIEPQRTNIKKDQWNKVEGKENFNPEPDVEDTLSILNSNNIDLNDPDKMPIIFDLFDCYEELEISSCEHQISNKDNFTLDSSIIEDLNNAQEEQTHSKIIKDRNENTPMKENKEQKDITEKNTHIMEKEQSIEKNNIMIISDKKISNFEAKKYVSQIKIPQKTLRSVIKISKERNDLPKGVDNIVKNNSEIVDEREKEEEKIIYRESKKSKITITNRDHKEKEKESNEKKSKQQIITKNERDEENVLRDKQELIKIIKKENVTYVKTNSINDKNNSNVKPVKNRKNYYNNNFEILKILED